MIELKHISKKYSSRTILKDINMNLEPGKVYGLFGPNGIGKTTLLKLMAGYLKKTSGKYLIEGENYNYHLKKNITFISDREIFYNWMKISDAVNYYDDFFADFDKDKCMTLLQSMQLNPKNRINTLSKGMKARLKVALAISRNAKLYLLDEPLGGLDPISRKIIIDSIKNLMNSDGILIITSHLINDISNIIDHVFFISEGKIILDKDINSFDLTNKKLEDYYVEVYTNDNKTY